MKYHFLLIVLITFACKESKTVLPESVQYEHYFVKAKPYLNIRKEPNLQSEKIGQIDFGSLVTIQEKSNTIENIDNQNGSWLKINHINITGWIFDGYLTKDESPFYNIKKVTKQSFSSDKSIYYILKSTFEGEGNCKANEQTYPCILGIFDKNNKQLKIISEIFPIEWDSENNLIALSYNRNIDLMEWKFFKFSPKSNFEPENLLEYTSIYGREDYQYLFPKAYKTGFESIDFACNNRKCFYFAKPEDSNIILVETIKNNQRVLIHKIEYANDFSLSIEPKTLSFHESKGEFEIDLKTNKISQKTKK